MKKIALITIFILAGFCAVNAQTATRERIVPAQAGTVQLTGGKATVTIKDMLVARLNNPDIKGSSYFVSLTPIGNCGQLNIIEKTNKQFTIQEVGSGNSEAHSFDYIIFVKDEQELISPQAEK